MCLVTSFIVFPVAGAGLFFRPHFFGAFLRVNFQPCPTTGKMMHSCGLFLVELDFYPGVLLGWVPLLFAVLFSTGSGLLHRAFAALSFPPDGLVALFALVHPSKLLVFGS